MQYLKVLRISSKHPNFIPLASGCVGFPDKSAGPNFLIAKDGSDFDSAADILTDTVTDFDDSIWYHCLTADWYFDYDIQETKVEV